MLICPALLGVRLKYTVLLLLCGFFSRAVLAQCSSTPFISIKGDVCVGSSLTATTNISPATVEWKQNGNTVATQVVNPSVSGVTVAGGNGSGMASNQFSSPNRLFVDSEGNLYIPDMGNNRVQKWAPGATAGVTVAGGKGAGFAPDQLNRPTSVFVDKTGDLYITDQNNNRVQKWAPGATRGATVVSGVSQPTCVFVDAGGNIYVSEQGSSLVSKWASGAAGSVVVAGGNGWGSAANQLSSPTGIFVAANGDLYVCDTDNSRVQKWPTGAKAGITVAGGSEGSAPHQLYNPLAVCVDPSGNVYIADYNNYRVQKWAPGASGGVTVAGGSAGAGNFQLNKPQGLAMDTDCNLYVSDIFNYRVQRFSPATSTTSLFTLKPGEYTATAVSASGETTVSNSITVLPPAVPKVVIVADTNAICPGTRVSFRATAVDGGREPVFQWKKNGSHVGTGSAVYTDAFLVDGDIVTCVLTSDAPCLQNATAISNAVVVQVRKPHEPVNLGPDLALCEGTAITLKAEATYTAYLWQDGSTGATFTTTQAGEYTVQVRDVCGSSTDQVKVSLYPKAPPVLPQDTSFCRGESVFLQAMNSFRKFVWNTGAVSDNIEVKSPGQYWLQVTDQNDCVWKDSIVVTQKECIRKLYVPSSFTPNGDGRNDLFRPLFTRSVKSFKFTVYNRWGQVVFQTSEPGKAWNGRVNGQLQQSAVYVWSCTYQFSGDEVKMEKGTVTIIR
jgi:gliding motility-associated-like protein